MSSFSVEVVEVQIKPHQNADNLELAQVGEYLSVVPKGRYASGNLVAYIPEQSLVPQVVQEELGIEGKLAGSEKNRVKAIKLRGILSQGLVYPARPEWKLGDNVADILGITKWEPTIPASMAGEVAHVGGHRTVKYDVENYKKYPELFEEGMPVVMTEKLHGTWTMIGLMAPKWEHPESGNTFVSSKGLASKGLVLKNNEANKDNLYWRIARKLGLADKWFALSEEIQTTFTQGGDRVFILGETFGSGVQDLKYGLSGNEVDFRVFDVYVASDMGGFYLGSDELDRFCALLDLVRVPVLYHGPFLKQKLYELTDGLETYSGKNAHVREGVIVRPLTETYAEGLPGNRLQLKSVSGDYLTRKGGTEYN
jgi:RNA ligase (TIGR02306 family)